MTGNSRCITAYLLALTLLLAGQAQAVARGAMDRMVLCTSRGAITLVATQPGSSQVAQVVCADCTLAALVGVVPHRTDPQPPRAQRRVAALAVVARAGAWRVVAPSARGPPRAA